MQIDDHPKQSLPEQSPPTVEGEGNNELRSITPAKLPSYSRAALAQRLNDVPEAPTRGVYYPVPHLHEHPIGWRIKRHGKRKNLRNSNLRFSLADRRGTLWALTPMAIFVMAFVIIATTIMTTYIAIQASTDQHFGQKMTTLPDILPKDSLKIYDSQGVLLYQSIDQGLQTSVPLSKISPHLLHAEIAIEDQNFWNNPGYDVTGIVRAALDDLIHGHVVGGGSTITQQLVKNAIVGSQTTMTRKLQEIILAPEVTRHFTKEQILEMYLNTIYYGQQAYGANAAAFRYYNLQDTPTHTAASQLDIAQAAMLAGIPSSPIARDPYLHPQAAFERVQEVLKQMYLQGYITSEERAKALDEVQQPGFLHHGVISNLAAPHFARYALNELAQELHVKVSDLSKAGLIVKGTLDLQLQNKVLPIAQRHIAEMAQAHHMSNAAVTMIDQHTGSIRILLGNIHPESPRDGAFDVASQGFRQPGSSFKPFIYATAFAQGTSPGEPVADEPLTIHLEGGLPPYSPQNYDLQYHGLITYRYALQNSFNIPAVKLLMKTGVDQALHTAQVMGIGDNYEGVPNYTMVLGSLSVHLLDETSAYGAFAMGGIHIPQHAIETVTDPSGKVIFHFQPVPQRVISKEAAFMITDVLSDNNSRTFEFGKFSALYLYSNTQKQCYAGDPGLIRPAAVKTGTSNDFRDNWPVGYTAIFVVGVWAGII